MKLLLFACLVVCLMAFAWAGALRAESCVGEIHQLPTEAQLLCLDAAQESNVTADVLASAVLGLTGRSDHRVAGGLLSTAGRYRGANTSVVQRALAAQLPHQAPLYAGRDKWHVLQLRALNLTALAVQGVPDEAIPMIEDAIDYVDERGTAVEFAAAVRAAGTLAHRGRYLIPGILTAVDQRFAEEELYLDSGMGVVTTAQIEAVTALGKLATRDDDVVVQVLTTLAGESSVDARATKAAKQALEEVRARRFEHHAVTQRPTRGDWYEPAARIPFAHASTRVQDHTGTYWSMADLLDRPTLLAYFYSSCQNAAKCSTTIARLAHLQRQLKSTMPDLNVRLLAVTYEPEFDTPERIRRYCTDRGLEFDPSTLGLRVDKGAHKAVLGNIGAAVGLSSSGRVTSHAVELMLLDQEGRVVRRYYTRRWDDGDVLADIRRLSRES